MCKNVFQTTNVHRISCLHSLVIWSQVSPKTFEHLQCGLVIMDNGSTVLVALMILGVLTLFLLILFWKLHLSKHLHHPVYKIRNPIFWMISLIGSALFVIIRCIIMYLAVNNRISSDVFAALSPLTLMCLGFSFFFGRYRQSMCLM